MYTCMYIYIYDYICIPLSILVGENLFGDFLGITVAQAAITSYRQGTPQTLDVSSTSPLQ